MYVCLSDLSPIPTGVEVEVDFLSPARLFVDFDASVDEPLQIMWRQSRYQLIVSSTYDLLIIVVKLFTHTNPVLI